MVEMLLDTGSFVFRVVVIVIAVLVVIGFIASMRGSKKSSSGSIILTNVTEHLQQQKEHLTASLLDKKALKLWKKQQKQKDKQAGNKKVDKKAKKAQIKKAKSDATAADPTKQAKVFVLDFDGDIKASQAQQLSREITAVIQLASNKDEVVLRLESAGGMVHGYGLASSQLHRLREHKIPLTVCVDKVAASGGYMMACMGNKILAAPFAILGSIGVVAQIPNFNKLLKNWQIDYEQHTSGKYKRTLTMLGENTNEGRKKFQQELDSTHKLFKDMVHSQRPDMNITKVSTGETWYGQQAIDVKLIDQVMTSDEYLYSLSKNTPIYHIAYKQKKTLTEKFGIGASSVIENVMFRWLQKDQEQQATRNG